MNIVWKEFFKIHTYDVDFKNKVRLSSIFNYMQEAATNHANHLKIGYDNLLEEDLFWVLSRVKIEIIHLPKLGDEIRIETWPKGTDKLFALRDFKIFNSENKIIAKATTAWLIIDSNKMRPKRPKLYTEKLPYLNVEHALCEVPSKITWSDKPQFVFEKKVGYSDIDINQHMNNVKYVELLMDSFPQSIFEEKQICSMQINFTSECKFGDIIYVFKDAFEDNPNCFYIEGINKNNHKKVFQSYIEWDKSL